MASSLPKYSPSFDPGWPGSQLVADTKVSAPRLSATTHLDLHRRLSVVGLAKNWRVCDSLQVVLQARIDAVADDIKEPALSAGCIDLGISQACCFSKRLPAIVESATSMIGSEEKSSCIASPFDDQVIARHLAR